RLLRDAKASGGSLGCETRGSLRAAGLLHPTRVRRSDFSLKYELGQIPIQTRVLSPFQAEQPSPSPRARGASRIRAAGASLSRGTLLEEMPPVRPRGRTPA